ncbi:calcineurin B homologous protein 1-like [Hydractinia symbiolongicarpus]|uniref:calcineurin B homologous protein 1-like n=1 Tax=Hydractinia symbiolongicarpus TaxID=13093 RepID=UPI00254D15AA|nr:calcineurin B homologous protein 1-like [Hydractinia symbiolongicarpus]
MGSKCSTIQLDESDIEEIQKETGFSPSQIKRLYSRFSNLDKDNNAFLSRNDLLRIPELAINPLGRRIIDSFFVSTEDEGINFSQFVGVLSRFRRCEEKTQCQLNTRENKLKYAFKMYDIDNTGMISKQNIEHMLTLMVGSNKSSEQLTAIADRTMQEADEDKDGYLSYEEFSKAMDKVDFQSKMSIRFLA